MLVLTRKLQASDSSATMSYHTSLVYLAAVLVLAPLPAMVGEVPDAHASIAFLIRAWSMPGWLDLLIMVGLGVAWASWTYFMARAYSLAQASVAAPFEYLSLPINVMWGFFIWWEIPTWMTWSGAALTLLSGMFILFLDRKGRQNPAAQQEPCHPTVESSYLPVSSLPVIIFYPCHRPSRSQHL